LGLNFTKHTKTHFLRHRIFLKWTNLRFFSLFEAEIQFGKIILLPGNVLVKILFISFLIYKAAWQILKAGTLVR